MHTRGYTHPHTRRHPTSGTSNSWKWLIMFYLELKLNLELKRQSTKPQCWESWNRKHLSEEEALPAPAVSGGAGRCVSKPRLSVEGWGTIHFTWLYILSSLLPWNTVHAWLYMLHQDYTCPTETERWLKMRRREVVIQESHQQNHYSTRESGFGVWMWWQIGAAGSWSFQVGCKEIQSAMNGSSVYCRQWEKWLSWNP